MRRVLRLFLGLLAVASAARAAWAEADPGTLCEQAILSAERRQQTPVRLMHAIGVVESGRPDPRTGAVHPWPWTINAEGAGRFFASEGEAIAAVQALQARGVRSIDVGCMQVNLMHHPTAFASLEEAFDPVANAAYAGRFLTALFHDLGTWPRATAAYHSQTEELGADYARRVMAVWGHPLPLAPSRGEPFVGIYALVDRQYRAFPPTQMIFGAFADPATLPASFRGYAGLPAMREKAAATRLLRPRSSSPFLKKTS